MLYRIHNDDNYLMHEVPAAESMRKLGPQYGAFAFNAKPDAYSKVWKPLHITFHSSAKGQHFPDASENYARLFLTEDANTLLLPLLSNCGESLPITHDQGAGFIFNTLCTAESLNAVNPQLTTHDEHGNLVHYGFNEDRLSDHALFKTELDNYTRLYCTEVFKQAVENANLKGIVFNISLKMAVSLSTANCWYQMES